MMTYAPRRPHAAHLPAGGGAPDGAGAGADAERHGGRPAHPGRARRSSPSCSKRNRSTCTNGDVIVLYTDGITEAMNAEADLFGDARLSRIVEEHGHLDSGELRERILREIEAFVGGADQHDDMTMILMKVEQPVPAQIGGPGLPALASTPLDQTADTHG